VNDVVVPLGFGFETASYESRHICDMRFLLIAICTLVWTASSERTVADVSPSNQFRVGDAAEYPAPIAHGTPLPPAASVADVVNDPLRYDEARVTLSGCYSIDPYHGAVLLGPGESTGGIAMFGGSDDIGDEDFDWMRDKICGRFVGTVYWQPVAEPFKYLCSDLCFVSEGTVDSKIVRDAAYDSALGKGVIVSRARRSRVSAPVGLTPVPLTCGEAPSARGAADEARATQGASAPARPTARRQVQRLVRQPIDCILCLFGKEL
jgi:hypothetical protein